MSAQAQDQLSPPEPLGLFEHEEPASTSGPLLSARDGARFKQRWEHIEVRFGEEPGASVKDANALALELMRRVAHTFTHERSRLEEQRERGEASTEDLRTALQQYQSFFGRLLVA